MPELYGPQAAAACFAGMSRLAVRPLSATAWSWAAKPRRKTTFQSHPTSELRRSRASRPTSPPLAITPASPRYLRRCGEGNKLSCDVRWQTEMCRGDAHCSMTFRRSSYPLAPLCSPSTGRSLLNTRGAARAFSSCRRAWRQAWRSTVARFLFPSSVRCPPARGRWQNTAFVFARAALERYASAR